MHPVERVVVHVLLAALVVAVLLDRPIIGSSAEAEPARAEEVLGPADRLVLLRDGDPVDVTRSRAASPGARARPPARGPSGPSTCRSSSRP